MGNGRGVAPRVRVPGPAAPVDRIVSFAGTYNAYEFFAADSESLERILWPIYDGIERSSEVPGWVQLDLARALLFYAYRRDHVGSGYGPYAPMQALVDHIRALSGGWVHDRSAPVPTGTTSMTSGSATRGEFADSWESSGDGLYRWWYERRWAPGPTLCFVGLNPTTGDADGKPRPTLGRVVGWARREGCGAVVVVNLFAYRATKPAGLFSAPVDIVGDANDNAIRERSASASITLVGWGAHPLARERAKELTPLLRDPQCVGTTKAGAPKHPLYIPASQPFEPYLQQA